jgi:hypothetical protein
MRFVAVVALAAVAAAPAASRATRPFAPAKESTPPLVGIVWKGKKAELARLDPATLAPLGRGVPAGRPFPAWSFSPDGRRLAFGGEGLVTVRIVDVGEMSLLASLKLSGAGSVTHVAWLAPDRLLVLHSRPDGARLVWIDPDARRVLKRASLDALPAAAVSGGGLLVALVPPVTGIGPGRLAVAGADGILRLVDLPSIRVGMQVPDDQGGGAFEQITPGLDPAGRRAYVIGTDGVAAEVDLDSLAVSTHALGPARSLFGRLSSWLVPAAQAKAANGESLQAQWLGNGIVAVAGTSYRASTDGNGGERQSASPLGLRLVDVDAWTERLLDPGATGFSSSPQALLAFGSLTEWGTGAPTYSGMGVAAYAPDGSQRFRLLAQQPVDWVQTHAGRGYASLVDQKHPWRFAVIDLARGAIERRVSLRPTWLFAGP